MSSCYDEDCLWSSLDMSVVAHDSSVELRSTLMPVMFEPPYGVIADLLKEGQVVPFLGAGVNFGSRPDGAAWDHETAGFLPSGVELSRFLAGKSSFPAEDERDFCDLAK